MAGYPFFGFMDESGVLSADPNQPFFALGLLLIEDCALLYQKLNEIRGKAIATTGARAKSFEFHFNSITRTTRPFYEEMVDAAVSFSNIRVCVFVLDKTDPKVNPGAFFPSIWDAYISYAKLVVKANLKNGDDPEQCVVIADYLNKPLASPRFFESELRALPCVINATMLESHACLFIQLVDLLVGAVVYEFRRSAGTPHTSDLEKRAVSNHLRNRLGVLKLSESFTVHNPLYFSVWKFVPK